MSLWFSADVSDSLRNPSSGRQYSYNHGPATFALKMVYAMLPKTGYMDVSKNIPNNLIRFVPRYLN